MTDEAAQVEQVEATDTAEPLFGGEFKTVEELEAAYAALKAPPAETPEALDAPEAADKEEPTETTEDEVTDALAKAGLDISKFNEEFHGGGALSDESYADLEKAGYGRGVVDIYLRGLRAEKADYEAELFAPVGGSEGYSKLLEWAGKNLDNESIDAFNASITSGDKARAKLAVAGLAAQFKGTSAAPAPTLLNGRTAGAGAVEPFKSRAEVNAAMRDPRYRTDSAYRQTVADRLRDSPAY